MKKAKILTALVCAVLALNTAAFAEDKLPRFEVTPTVDNVKTSEAFYVLVDLKDNIGFGALQFQMSYDPEKLLLSEVTAGEIITDGAITSVNTDIVGEINFSVISAQDITESGTVLVSKFTAKNGGEALLDLKILAYADSGGTSLDARLIDSKVVVESKKTTNSTGTGGTSHSSGGSGSSKNNKTDKADETVISKNDKADETVESKTDTTDEPLEPTEPKNEHTETEQPEAKKGFTDVSATHWARDYIEKALTMGIVSGYEDGEFKPDREMTRAEFVTILWNAVGKPEASASLKFTDVSENDWFYKQVVWGYSEGIISGMSAAAFSPNDKLTREQAVTILYRYSGSPEAENGLDRFIDSVHVSDYAKNAMNWAISNGIISGINETELSPKTSATRAQLATIMVRFLNK